MSHTVTAPSANLLADTIFANGLGAHPEGLVSEDDTPDPTQELLPLRQRMSSTMLTAHDAVDDKLGSELATFTLAELQALRTQITLREKQLLTHEPTDLFAPIDPKDHGFVDSVVPDTATREDTACPQSGKLSLAEYVQIQEENTDLAEIVSTRATADLVQHLRKPAVALKIPGQLRGQTPLSAAISFVASTLRLTFAAVDKRITAAAGLWPQMNYRQTKLETPRLAAHLEQGRIPLETAAVAQQKLSDIRQAVRRAGGDQATADDLVAQKEREFVHHALRNNPHTFSRYAKSRSDAVTNSLIGPKKPLTDDQFKHEKGIFYDGPVGDTLHRITAIVDEGELLHLNAIRELASKFHSTVAKVAPQNDQPSPSAAQSSTDETADSDEVTGDPRITPADVDLGLAKLFDGRTSAERWLNTMMDFLSAGLILRKTYAPKATEAEQQDHDQTLQKAAKHSEVLADLLGFEPREDADTDSYPPDGAVPPRSGPLAPLVPAGYQLLHPNLEVIVELSLQDLIGAHAPASVEETLHTGDKTNEISKIVELLKQPHHTNAPPTGSPGHLQIDYGLARQLACTNNIIPMVVGSASQPLDVGRSQRLFPRAIRRALHVRDRGCVVPGCPIPAVWCEGHHIVPWELGGTTQLTNAALLCRHHHGASHKQLLYVHMEADGIPSVSLPRSIDPTETRYRNVFWQK
ncbi:HNH endonuclease [Yaniella halotolerans]|uniref:HNH endonuclease n=1 Tax=Yaniella halotolerans TaxID=225453 RepID=UPI0003B4E023|nr:HNH endonuclease signature motif containing protein [Yaniella halotolerans]